MTSIDAMSENEARKYIRAEINCVAANPRRIDPAFRRTLTDQWKRDGRLGISPLTRRYPLDELSKMLTEWLQTRNTLH